MTDDPMKKYWDQRRAQAANQQQPHQGHPNFGSRPNGPAIPQDGDITNMLIKRVADAAMNQQSSTTAVVDLIEGYPYYVAVENSFGGTQPIIRKAGVISGNTSRNVQLKKEVTGILINENQAIIDLAKPDSNQKISLMEISVPFIGSFLVPKESIVRKSPSGRNILKG